MRESRRWSSGLAVAGRNSCGGSCDEAGSIDEWNGIAVAKKNAGQHWEMVFRGDSSGARCLKQPYRLVEQTDEVIMEIKVPFWMDKDDIKVRRC